MTFGEFRALLAKVPEHFDDFDLSSYTDVGEIAGVWLDEERSLVWLSERPGIGTNQGVHATGLDQESDNWKNGSL